jgi:hypothetical protein
MPAPINDIVLFSELEPTQFEIASGKYRIKPSVLGVSNQVAVQIANPNIVPPASIPTPVKGDVIIQTSDGTPTGQLQASYVWSGSTWVMQSGYTAPTALASPSVRTYFNATTAFIDRFEAAETAATIAGRGFTAVGPGATVGPSALGQYIMSHLINLSPGPGAVQSVASVAAIFTPPTAYIRHELAITAGVTNGYFLKCRSSLADQNVDVWVCDAITGVPVERLHGNASTRFTTSDPGTAFSLGPDESNGEWNREYEWMSFLIPAAVVAARKTATNTIKLAIRKGIGAGNLSSIEISGYAMAAVGNSQFVSTPVFVHDNQQNGGIQWGYAGVTTGNPYSTLAASVGPMTQIPPNIVTGEGIRVSIPDITKDCYLSLLSHGNGYTYYGKSVQLTIASTTGPVLIGRPRPGQIGRLAELLCGQSGLGAMSANGWLIPASILAAKAIKPVGSAVYYLDVQVSNLSDLAAYGAGWFVETV